MWQGRRVLITGHTGFKGGWLAMLQTNVINAAWHRAWRAGVDMHRFTLSQITAFEQTGGKVPARPTTVASRCEEAA